MDDLRTVIQIALKHKLKLTMVFGLACLSVWLYGGARILDMDTSPNGMYRLEFYRARHYQRLLHPQMQEPGFVRLYWSDDNDLIAESNVADFFGGTEIFWHMAISGEIAVGRDIVFEGIAPITPSTDAPDILPSE
jgi:hypothetical protein